MTAAVEITSYGVLHAPAPEGDALSVDLRTVLRKPLVTLDKPGQH